MTVSYWEFTFKDTPGDRKKGVPAEARKVSTENRRAVVTQLYMQLLNMGDSGQPGKSLITLKSLMLSMK